MAQNSDIPDWIVSDDGNRRRNKPRRRHRDRWGWAVIGFIGDIVGAVLDFLLVKALWEWIFGDD